MIVFGQLELHFGGVAFFGFLTALGCFLIAFYKDYLRLHCLLKGRKYVYNFLWPSEQWATAH